MSEAAWYVLHSKPRQEGLVASYLEAEGLLAFCPVTKVTPVNPRASKERAFFPGYLFVLANIEDVGVSKLQWLPGSLGLIGFGGTPAVVPDSFITELRQRMAELAVAPPVPVTFTSGDRVEITRGSFVGVEGIFDSMLDDRQRVKIFIHWLSRRVTMQINVNSIARKQAG